MDPELVSKFPEGELATGIEVQGLDHLSLGHDRLAIPLAASGILATRQGFGHVAWLAEHLTLFELGIAARG